MSGLQLAVLSGALIGLGVTLIVARLVPAHPDLQSVLGAGASRRTATLYPDSAEDLGFTDRLGMRVQRRAPGLLWAWVPTSELTMLRRPVHRYFGEKVLYAVMGLLFPLLATVILLMVGIRLPFTVPVGAALLLAVVLSFLPDYNARDDAARARQEFIRALGAYIDLVALERHAGAGSTQALEVAAEVGDSWVFLRIREELARARWAGQAPWDGLAHLADELRLPELADVADIMRLSGEEGASVYVTLRARSAGLRAALLSEEHTKANSADERLTFPIAMLAFIFLTLVSAPGLAVAVFGGTS